MLRRFVADKLYRVKSYIDIDIGFNGGFSVVKRKYGLSVSECV